MVAMEPARSIIAKCGGLEPTALACDRSAKTVRKWMVSKEKRGTGGLVPSECQVQLLLASRENGWGLTPADFFPPEVVAPAEADAPVAEAEG